MVLITMLDDLLTGLSWWFRDVWVLLDFGLPIACCLFAWWISVLYCVGFDLCFDFGLVFCDFVLNRWVVSVDLD